MNYRVYIVIVLALFATGLSFYFYQKNYSAKKPAQISLEGFVVDETNSPIKSIVRGEAPDEMDTVTLKDGRQLKDIGYKLSYLGLIEAPGTEPLILFRGHNCIDCHAEDNIFIYSTKFKAFETAAYSARLINADTKEFNFESRVYLGQCLGEENILVNALQFKVEGKEEWSERVMIFANQNGAIDYTNSEDPQIVRDTMARVKGSRCREIPAGEPREYH